jgi:hypothetical protein
LQDALSAQVEHTLTQASADCHDFATTVLRLLAAAQQSLQ